MILYLDNAISGLDFNPSGALTASIDHYGVCLISDINTDDYSFHLQMSLESGNLSNYLSLCYRNMFSFELQEIATKIFVANQTERPTKFLKKFRREREICKIVQIILVV